MDVVILKDGPAVCKEASRRIADQVNRKADSVLGLATGNTMVGVYKDLVRRHREAELDCSEVTTFNLDEYVGLAPEHPCSYHTYMNEHLFSKVPFFRNLIPDSSETNFVQMCADYEAQIQGCGGIDLQLLGLGRDGHIGFNEPCSSLSSRTRLKTLTPMTVGTNKRHFPEGQPVPYHVITMGIATIMEAREVLLLAFGESKVDAIAAMVEGPVSAMCPASALQYHPHCTVLIDEVAASKLKMADYFRFIHQNWLEG